MEYMLRRLDIIDRWKGYTDNRFLKELAQGSLPSEKFEYYLSQDYHLLVCIVPLSLSCVDNKPAGSICTT